MDPIGMLIMHWNEIWAFFDTLPAGAANKGKAIIDGLIGGISAKWESLKNKIKALTDLLPDWMKGGGSVTANVNPSGYLTGNYTPRLWRAVRDTARASSPQCDQWPEATAPPRSTPRSVSPSSRDNQPPMWRKRCAANWIDANGRRPPVAAPP